MRLTPEHLLRSVPGRRPRAVWFALALGWVSVSGLVPGRCAAQDVEARHKAPVLLKLLTYDRRLTTEETGPIRIGILHRPGVDAARERAHDLAEAFEALSAKTIEGRTFAYRVMAWTDATLADAADHVDVFYVGAELRDDHDAIRGYARTHGILTLAATERQVRDGLSVALTIESGRPIILVNLDAVAREGHDLDARILRICRVIGGG